MTGWDFHFAARPVFFGNFLRLGCVYAGKAYCTLLQGTKQ